MNTAPEDVTPVEVPRVIVRNNKIPPKLGAQVIYVLAERDSVYGAGRARPGIIVDLVQDGSVDGLVNIMIFTNAHADQLPNTHHVREILHDEDEHKPGTWHWPPPRELVFMNQPVEAKFAPTDSDDKEPFPSTPDTGSMAAAFASGGLLVPPAPDAHERLESHIKEKGYHVGEVPPGFDPVAAARPTSPEPFPSEEPESR